MLYRVSGVPTAMTADLAGDFHGTLARLRASAPVAWISDLGGWLVTSRALVVEVLRDPVRFTVDDPRFSTQRVIGPSMLSLDGAEHTRHRGPFEVAFRRGDPTMLRARMTAMADGLVGGVAGDGRADLRLAIAAPLAVAVMVDALGLVDVGSAELLSWYAQIVDATVRMSMGEDRASSAAGAMASLRHAVERSAEVSALLREATSDLSVDELVSNVAVLLFGGVETSEAMTANAFVHLLSIPNLLDQVATDRSLVTAFVEESVRLEPAAAQLDRYATVDMSLGGVHIRRGDFVTCSVAGANRDPAFFDQPDTFVLGRPNARLNVSFAQGSHACLATHVAKAETEAAITSALRALTDLHLAGPTPEIAGIVFRKAVSVPVAWTV